MEVLVTGTTNKTISACAIAIEGSSSSNNMSKMAMVVIEEWMQ